MDPQPRNNKRGPNRTCKADSISHTVECGTQKGLTIQVQVPQLDLSAVHNVRAPFQHASDSSKVQDLSDEHEMDETDPLSSEKIGSLEIRSLETSQPVDRLKFLAVRNVFCQDDHGKARAGNPPVADADSNRAVADKRAPRQPEETYSTPSKHEPTVIPECQERSNPSDLLRAFSPSMMANSIHVLNSSTEFSELERRPLQPRYTHPISRHDAGAEPPGTEGDETVRTADSLTRDAGTVQQLEGQQGRGPPMHSPPPCRQKCSHVTLLPIIHESIPESLPAPFIDIPPPGYPIPSLPSPVPASPVVRSVPLAIKSLAPGESEQGPALGGSLPEKVVEGEALEEKCGIDEMWQKIRELNKEVRQLKEESAKKDQVLVALLRQHHLATQVCSPGP